MIIKKIRLNNIRSYLDEVIHFSDNSTLLAGEIGSGKSSILLAIEFALFGIARGVLSGTSLLRVGEKEGFVELHFTISGKDVVIKRTLRRIKDDVRQHTGYLIINGKKTAATAVELKSKILELLGYPAQLLTKSKSLIYRYTVYTPQEEMKRILTEQSEYRIDTLRKLFQIDKYKRIRENTQIILRSIKQSRNILRGQIQNLDEKQKQLASSLSEVKNIESKLKIQNSQISEILGKLKQKQTRLLVVEKDLDKLNSLHRELDIANILLKEKVINATSSKNEIEAIRKQILVLQENIQNSTAKKKDTEILDRKLKTLLHRKEKLIQHQTDTKHQIRSQNEIISDQLNMVDKIINLNKCPVCRQEISAKHISHIKSEQSNKISRAKKNIDVAGMSLSECNLELDLITSDVLKLNEMIKNANKQNLLVKEKENLIQMLQEKQKQLSLLLETQKLAKVEIGTINAKKITLQEQISTYKDKKEDLEKIKAEFEQLKTTENQATVRQAHLKAELQALVKAKELLETEVNQKLKAKKQIIELAQKQHWIEELFINLMINMEQHVMMRIYYEFNEIFQQFFETLIETETLSVRLDEEFNPVIEQEGYDISYADLSGGEKTSLALAYRLALNKVVNDLVETIKTKDLIILDEPTDGFSTSQLDKVRMVLELLNTKQTIIVSHESKIESFVDNIIRIEKQGHISKIA